MQGPIQARGIPLHFRRHVLGTDATAHQEGVHLLAKTESANPRKIKT